MLLEQLEMTLDTDITISIERRLDEGLTQVLFYGTVAEYLDQTYRFEGDVVNQIKPRSEKRIDIILEGSKQWEY